MVGLTRVLVRSYADNSSPHSHPRAIFVSHSVLFVAYRRGGYQGSMGWNQAVRSTFLYLVSTDGLQKAGESCRDLPWIGRPATTTVCDYTHWTGRSPITDGNTINLQEKFSWTNMEQNARRFVRWFIYCIYTQGKGSTFRTFGPAFHGTELNDLLQFSYIALGPSVIGTKWVLMSRDKHSGYSYLSLYQTSRPRMTQQLSSTG